MITLIGASRFYRGRQGELKIILQPTDLHFGGGEKIGILTASGGGKSTLARLLSGIDLPDLGSIRRQGRISWPVGFAGILHPDLLVIENLNIIAGLLGENRRTFVGFCDSFAGLGDLLYARMSRVTPAERALLGYCCSLAVQYDMYISDEAFGVGSGDLRLKSEALFKQRLASAGMIYLSSSPAYLEKHCDRYFCLLNGRLIGIDDPAIGAQALSLVSASRS
ncbi:MAG: ATP-binding cassette domain-containing protein [Paracoccus sp. (in: a-proteobacteria)]